MSDSFFDGGEVDDVTLARLLGEVELTSSTRVMVLESDELRKVEALARNIGSLVEGEFEEHGTEQFGEGVKDVIDDVEHFEAVDLAKKFHEVYERLAHKHDYCTRAESAKPWDDVPENNRELMTETCREVLKWLAKEIRGDVDERVAVHVGGG